MAEKQIIEQKSYKTVYREGNLIVKEFTASHPKSDVFNEAYIHACVEDAGVPVSKLLGVNPANGGWAIALEYVEGETLKELMQAHPEKIDEYLEKLVDIQLETGSYRVRNLRNTRVKMEDAIKNLTEIDASTRYELLQRIHGMPQHSKLCHGDFVPSNVIIREDDCGAHNGIWVSAINVDNTDVEPLEDRLIGLFARPGTALDDRVDAVYDIGAVERDCFIADLPGPGACGQFRIVCRCFRGDRDLFRLLCCLCIRRHVRGCCACLAPAGGQREQHQQHDVKTCCDLTNRKTAGCVFFLFHDCLSLLRFSVIVPAPQHLLSAGL